MLLTTWWRALGPALATCAAAAACLAVRAAFARGAASGACALCAACALGGAAAAGTAWARSRMAFRARVFAPVGTGPAWEPLLRATYARAQDEARRLGFAFIAMNADVTDAAALALCGLPRTARLRPATQFWQKMLRRSARDPLVGGALPPLASRGLFDPRVI